MKREYPNNIESEKIILGSMIIDNQIIPETLNFIDQKHYFNDHHKTIHGIISHLYNSDKPVESIAILETAQSLKTNIPPAEINLLGNYAHSIEIVQFHCALVIEKWILRNLIDNCMRITDAAFSQNDDVFDFISGAVAKIERSLDVKYNAHIDVNFYDRLEEIFQNIKKERDGSYHPAIKTVYHPTFNNATGGLRGGNIVAISGRWKAGKTTVAAAIIKDFVIQKLKVAWFSLEVSEYEMDLKFVSFTGTRYGYLRNPADKTLHGDFRFSDDDLERTIANAMREYHDTNLYINDMDMDINRIINKLRTMKKKHGIDIAAIDYIGLIENPDKSERRDLEIATLSRRLKQTARELDIPIFILSQENEDGKTSDSKALLRDADFWFSIKNAEHFKGFNKTTNTGKWAIRIDGKEYVVELNDNGYFELRNNANRHGSAGHRALYRYVSNGEYVEIDPVHSQSFEHSFEQEDTPI